MAESILLSIINRLLAMTKDQTDDLQIRRFEIDGQLLVKVYYNKISGMFKVINSRTSESFVFEDIDLVAIEIYDLLYPMKFNRDKV